MEKPLPKNVLLEDSKLSFEYELSLDNASNSKENSQRTESILERASKLLKRTGKYSRTDEIVCACYLLKFKEYGDKNAYDKFKMIWKNLSDEKKKKALSYYLTYKKNREIEKKNKQRARKK